MLPGLAQWVMDLGLSQQRCESQLQLRLDPWPGSSICSGVAKNEKNKKTKKHTHTQNPANSVKTTTFSFFSVCSGVFFVCFLFPGEGSNPSHSCDLCHNSGNAGSLTRCAIIRTPVLQFFICKLKSGHVYWLFIFLFF